MTRLEKYLAHLQRFGIAPGLERIQALLARCDNPQHQYPIVLIGGTNGKGSTSEFLARDLAANNLNVGLYTSPHLYKWNERIRVLNNSQRDALFPGAILDDQLDALFQDALPHIESIAADESLGQPTEFETVTFLGLWHFARAGVDAAVVEVGLGGRWDATNVTEPTISVITHVALDHCDRLGSTLEEIARDKVAIARPGRVLVTAETKENVLAVMREHCDEIGARLWSFRAPDYSNHRLQMQKTLELLHLEQLKNADTPHFQKINAATAQVARAALAQQCADLNLSPATPIIQYSVPGRLEVVRDDPRVVLDGANNPDGAAHLTTQLKEMRQERGGRLILVLGILVDKDFRAMIETLSPLAHTVIATQSNSPRAAEAAIVAQEAARFCPNVETVTPVSAAYKRALDLAQPDDIVCITGSFYTISEVPR